MASFFYIKGKSRIVEERRGGRGRGTGKSRWTGNCGRAVTYERRIKKIDYHLINKQNLHRINLKFSTLKMLKK